MLPLPAVDDPLLDPLIFGWINGRMSQWTGGNERSRRLGRRVLGRVVHLSVGLSCLLDEGVVRELFGYVSLNRSSLSPNGMFVVLLNWSRNGP